VRTRVADVLAWLQTRAISVFGLQIRKSSGFRIANPKKQWAALRRVRARVTDTLAWLQTRAIWVIND